MDIPALIDDLAFFEDLPAEAILAARAHREEAAPALIALVERYLADDDDAVVQQPALFWAFHLLGEWREPAAYRPLARLLASDEDEVNAVLGDATTASTHRVMAGLFDGDPRPLYDVIEAENACPFVRSRMLETLAMLVLRGSLGRDEVARYLRDAFVNLRPQHGSFVWYGWQSAIAALGLAELSDLVRQAFARQLIDPADLSLADFEADLEHAREHPDAPWRSAAPNEFALFDDTLAEFASWQLGGAEDLDLDEDWAPDDEVARPAINPFKGVGRNDPCPCGSGRKFKKCCLA